MGLDVITDWLADYYPIFIVIGILAIPTILHFWVLSQGWVSPHFLRSLAINTPFKAIVGIVGGVGFGFLINKKFGGED